MRRTTALTRAVKVPYVALRDVVSPSPPGAPRRLGYSGADGDSV
ncbi:hypothetical protein [Streptomyces sp. NPDC058385]